MMHALLIMTFSSEPGLIGGHDHRKVAGDKECRGAADGHIAA
jgi:hypothetical protein